MQTVQFNFQTGQDVVINRTGIKGTVKSLYIDEDGIKYAFVEYADVGGRIQDKYFREDKLRELDGSGK